MSKNNVILLEAHGQFSDSLTEMARESARRMIALALEAEVGELCVPGQIYARLFRWPAHGRLQQ